MDRDGQGAAGMDDGDIMRPSANRQQPISECAGLRQQCQALGRGNSVAHLHSSHFVEVEAQVRPEVCVPPCNIRLKYIQHAWPQTCNDGRFLKSVLPDHSSASSKLSSDWCNIFFITFCL